MGLLVARDIHYHDRDVVGLRVRVAISGPRKYLLKQTPGKLLGGEAPMCVEEIAQPGLSEFLAIRVRRLSVRSINQQAIARC